MKKIKKTILSALDYLEQNPLESVSKVAKLFHVDRHTLSDYRSKNINKNLLFENSEKDDDNFLYLFSEEELEIIEYYKEHSDEPYKNLKAKFPKAPDVRALRNWMNIMGNTYHTGAIQKYHYNREKFNKIETEEDAYWLGFITADGCVTEDNWCLQIKLAAKDEEHLVKFCKYLEMPKEEIVEIIKDGIGGAYTRNNPVKVVKICSKEIVKNLQNKNIQPQKSGKEIPYNCSSLDLQTAYIRGLIDGDGYLRSTQFGIGLVGSKEICSYVFNFINTNIVDISNNHIHEHGVIWKLELSGKLQTSKIAKFLYKDADIYLQRKYDLFLERYNN